MRDLFNTTDAPTHVLTERVPADVHLSGADVTFLRTHHRRHVALASTGRRGVVRVLPRGHVGVLAAPDCRLIIRPKFPLDCLSHLLDSLAPAATHFEAAQVGDALLDALAVRLAGLMSERAALGLQRGYSERAEYGPFLHGRLDLAAQLRDGPGKKGQLHSRHDDFSVDVPWNRLPCAAAQAVLHSPVLGESARTVLQQALHAFAGVGPAQLTSDSWRLVAPEGYAPLLEVARLITEGLASVTATGPVPFPGFLLDLDRVFERYVTVAVVRAAAAQPEMSVAVQPLFDLARPQNGPALSVRPDLTVDRAGQPWMVIDTKWKDLARGGPIPGDTFQAVAYAATLGRRRAALVYPGRRSGFWVYSLPRVPLRLEVHRLRICGPRAACTSALERLVTRFLD